MSTRSARKMVGEADRQRALLDALFARRAADAAGDGAHHAAADAAADAAAAIGLRETGPRARRGLDVYRANAEALAERALAAVYPRIRTMLGEDEFARLAAALWREHPPTHGDVGTWGDALPRWLAGTPTLAAWPYLADCARLDLALHEAERADDASFDAASLSLLGSEDPAQLRLLAVPGSALIASDWPIVTIHAAHLLDDGAAADAAFADVRTAIDARRAETALVWRDGWRARVVALDAGNAAWTRTLLEGATLGAALDGAPAGFDFAAWLSDAIAQHRLKGVARIGD